MLAEECHKLIDQNYLEPILKEWSPSEYDLKYKFKQTARGQKKLIAQKEKEDAKLKAIFDKESSQKKSVHKTIDEVASYPKEVSELFLSTFKWTIDDIVRKHEEYLKKKEEINSKHGKEIADHIGSLKYLIEETHWESSWSGRGHYATRVLADIPDEKWETWLNRTYTTKEFKNVKDRKELFKDYKELKSLRESDDIATYGSEAYPMAIRKMADTLSRILDEIKRVFDESKPTECLTDATWGVDGHFNGLLTDGNKKVNFLSFGAGGYNVQRYHFRFKITELKG